MKKLSALALFGCLLISAPGCGGPEGGSVSENAEQSAIEAYQAAEAADQAAQDASLNTEEPE
ncbi:MAG: hypothetical protein AB8B91_04240 [Rubripirellula sp.]